MICINCGKEHDGSFASGKFCNIKCSRSFATKLKRSQINKTLSLKFKGTYFGGMKKGYYSNIKNLKQKQDHVKKRTEGLNKYYEKLYSILEYENLPYKKRKEILWKEQNNKCSNCDFNKEDYKTGPYHIHHKDGDNLNRKRENETLLCFNCHYMTKQYGFKSKKHTQETKNKQRNQALLNSKNKKIKHLKYKINGPEAKVAGESPKLMK